MRPRSMIHRESIFAFPSESVFAFAGIRSQRAGPCRAPLILTFAPVFSKRTWHPALVLLWGAILAPRKRTVTSALRIMGLSGERQFQKYHRVLNRAIWDSRRASQLLLQLLIAQFVPSGPVVIGIDDTIERRRGSKI